MSEGYRTLDPATGVLLERYPFAEQAEIDRKLAAAMAAFAAERRRPFAERAALLERLADRLEARAGEFAGLMALEMGKTLAEGRAEAQKCAWVCRHFAAEGEAMIAPRRLLAPSAEEPGEAWLRAEPLGPILAIMPWNFPFWQVFRFAAPTLALGNVVLLKHAPATPRCAAAIEALFAEAGAEPGVFQNLRLDNEQVAALIENPAIRGVTLTGSTRAGREVAAVAGRALKPMVAELGGSDPCVVFAAADFDLAVKTAVASRCLNNGQSCISAKRFLVERPIFERFAEAFTAAMRARKVGDPRAAGIEQGPLARADLRDQLARQVERAVASGAKVLCGGERPGGPGFFYPPTVLRDLPPEAEVAREEFFGPVATLYPFEGDDQAIVLANATPYGLAAALWTADRERAWCLASRLECGSVFVNGLVKSDPRLPFGGVKDSGFGRELAREGLLEFANLKTVWLDAPR